MALFDIFSLSPFIDVWHYYNSCFNIQHFRVSSFNFVPLSLSLPPNLLISASNGMQGSKIPTDRNVHMNSTNKKSIIIIIDLDVGAKRNCNKLLTVNAIFGTRSFVQFALVFPATSCFRLGNTPMVVKIAPFASFAYSSSIDTNSSYTTKLFAK